MYAYVYVICWLLTVQPTIIGSEKPLDLLL